MNRRSIVNKPRVGLILPLLAVALLLPACEGGGHFTVLGYTTRPNYDTNIHTVYVPIFKNKTLYRGLEFDLTRAVVREIESKTPFKVESDCNKADTELLGTVVTLTKNILNLNQLNEVREAETVLGVEVIWRDRRTGEILSKPRAPGEITPIAPSLPVIGSLPGTPPETPVATPIPPLPPGAQAAPVLVQSIGGFIPELGQSTTTAFQENVNRLATHIVSLMEKPW